MTTNDYDVNYGKDYHTYPVYSNEMSHEGAVKKYRPMPTPTDVFNYALLGLPKILPMTREQMTPEIVEPFLESAIVDIESEMSCNISEVTHFFPVEYVDGMFTSNFTGILLNRWPATEIIKMVIKYPHTLTKDIYQSYTIPPAWIALFRNKVNVVAGVGSMNLNVQAPSAATAGGIFSFITGFSRGAWQPAMIEITYKAGFSHDKLPANVADLIKTWASLYFLADIAPVLFPNSSVQVSVDAISQGVSYNIQQTLNKRLEDLEKKKTNLKRNFKKEFGKTIGMSFVGA